MLMSIKPFSRKKFHVAMVLAITLSTASGLGQPFQPTPGQTMTISYPPQLLNELKQIQQAALRSDYAYRQLSHITSKIGPRLSGSKQAQQAVDYVAGELRHLGLEVRLEKVLVPHWVRGEETAELVKFPGQMSATAQRIVLTTLGGSVATPPNGLTAEVVKVQMEREATVILESKDSPILHKQYGAINRLPFPS